MEVLSWAAMLSGWVMAWWYRRKWLKLSLAANAENAALYKDVKKLEARLRYAKSTGGIDPADEEKGDEE